MNEKTDTGALKMYSQLDSTDKAIVMSLTEMLASAIANTIKIQLAIRQRDSVKIEEGIQS